MEFTIAQYLNHIKSHLQKRKRNFKSITIINFIIQLHIFPTPLLYKSDSKKNVLRKHKGKRNKTRQKPHIKHICYNL